MSDPMTTIEIEDVLSSIRRLVSEDLRPPRDRAGLRAVPREVETAPMDKLVLMPAQRVDTAGDEAAVPETAEHGGVVTRYEELPDADSFEPDEGDEMVSEAPVRVAATQSWQPEAWDEPFDDGLRFGRKGRRDPAGPEEADAAGTSAETLPAEATAAPVRPRRLHLSPAAEAVAPEPPHQPTAEPERERPTRLVRADAEPAEAAPQLPADDYDDAGDMMVIDADALREIVVAILKQELQGPLGERITRNVRKLVRAEIHRMLETRELE